MDIVAIFVPEPCSSFSAFPEGPGRTRFFSLHFSLGNAKFITFWFHHFPSISLLQRKKNIKITEIIKIIPKSYTIKETKIIIGSGCGSVGRAVASDTRDPQYKSRHRQNIIYQLYNRKDRNKEKEAGNGPSLKRENKNIFDLDRNFSHFRLVNKGSAKCLS